MDPKPLNLLSDEKPPSRRKTLFISLIAGLFLLFFIFLKVATPATSAPGVMLHPRPFGLFEAVRNFIFNTEPELEGQEEDRINILLLGMGGPGHDGPYLTDTNIILSVKPSTKEVAMISIPRDLGVQIPGHGVRKINSANAFGELASPGNGGDYTRQVFGETLGIQIPYYVRIDFKAFTELVDEVGGVTVNVPRTFTDAEFPGPNFSFRTIHFDAGTQTLNGETALEFARSRHGNNGEGSDFARSRRQQLVLMSLKEKLLSAGTYANPAVIQQVLGSLSAHITTNLSASQIVYLGGLAKEINGSPKNLVLDNSPSGFLISTTGESGAFLLLPKTGDYVTINHAIQGIFETAGTSTPVVLSDRITVPDTTFSTKTATSGPSIRVEVQNGTWRAGLAARFKERLQEKGFTVITVGNSLKRPIEKTTIYLLNPAADSAATKALSAFFKAPLATVLPDWLQETYNNPNTSEDEAGMKYNKEADVIVILGADTKE